MNKCIYCGKFDNDFNGIIIKYNYICLACETKLTSVKVDDEKYDYYIKGLKKIWRCFEV
ncbi:sigma factor G inhibitor Gin [Desulfolucanica intricata]|uniref:sigma factor G inhibitor Gin n=1 Tax=Desulfolucanica intricata TaxID=1285191 RepID=UPI0009ED046E|nr:sigma factor G inhibitor Gin [Desulfolucanica intricata]